MLQIRTVEDQLERRQRPFLDRLRRRQRPFDRALAFLDVLLACAALIVEADDALGAPRHVGDDEADTGI